MFTLTLHKFKLREMGTFTFEVDWKSETKKTATNIMCGWDGGGRRRGRRVTSDETSMPFLMEKNNRIQVVPNVLVSAYHR